MQFHELLYISRATKVMTVSDLLSMLDHFREKNKRLNITGMLVHHNGEFMQLLEGTKEDVMALYDTISQDRRHQQIHMVWEGPIEKRAFAQWSMAFVHADDLAIDQNPAYSSFLKDGLIQTASGLRRSVGRSLLVSLRNDFLSR